MNNNKGSAEDSQAIERRDLLKKIKKEIIIDDEDEDPRDNDDDNDEVRTPIGSPSSNGSRVSPRRLWGIEIYKPAEDPEKYKSHREEDDDRPMCKLLKKVRFPVKNMESEKLQRQVAEIASTLANIEKMSLETAISMVEEQDENNNWKRVKFSDVKVSSSGESSASTDVGSSVSTRVRDTSSDYSRNHNDFGKDERASNRDWYYSAELGWFQASLNNDRNDIMLQARTRQGRNTRWKSRYFDANVKSAWEVKTSHNGNNWYPKDNSYRYPKW